MKKKKLVKKLLPKAKPTKKPIVKKPTAKKAAKNRSTPPEQSTSVERIVEVVAFIAEVFAVNATHVPRIISTHPELLRLFKITEQEVTNGVIHRAERHRREVNRSFLATHNTPSK